MTIGYLQRGVFTAGGERASLSIRASICCYPPATEQYADFADRRIYPRMLRIAADLPADYADFTNGFWGVQIDGFFRGLLPTTFPELEGKGKTFSTISSYYCATSEEAKTVDFYASSC